MNKQQNNIHTLPHLNLIWTVDRSARLADVAVIKPIASTEQTKRYVRIQTGHVEVVRHQKPLQRHCRFTEEGNY